MGFDLESFAEATSGAVGGLVSTTILYPLDTCKTKYQAESQSRKYGSSLDVLREAIAKRQLLSLYQGLSTKNLQSIISQFLYFYSYSFFRQFYLRRANIKHMGTGANLIIAAAAGACTVVIIQPLDTASSQMQTSSFGLSKGLCTTITGRSWKEAYAGLGISLLLTCNPAIQYTVFEQAKRRVLRTTRVPEQVAGGTPILLSALQAFLLGAFSKTVATILTYPAIRLKTVIQAAESEGNRENSTQDRSRQRTEPQTPTISVGQTLCTIFRHDGVLGFYRGLQAQILKTILGAALMLMIKEKTSQGTWWVMLAVRKWSLVGKAKVEQLKLPLLITKPGTVTGAALASRVIHGR